MIPDYVPGDVRKIWAELAEHMGDRLDKIAVGQVEAYCGQVARLRDAQRRIADEGTIVADGKSQPVPHPALTIERQAQAEILKWGPKFNRR